MNDSDIQILKGDEIISLLEGRELEVVEVVRRAYEAHAEGNSSLPHSMFLRFPNDEKNRIIALPAFLGNGFSVAGIKWVSSFTDNLKRGLDRASAVMILNSTVTGRPEAILEGSVISAKRTAASAALAAHTLLDGRDVKSVGMIGCGLINFETARFLHALCPQVQTLRVYDLDAGRAAQFGEKCAGMFEHVEVAAEIETICRESSVIALATTATQPHIKDLSACLPGAIILHTSLRDLAPEVILAADNVVDDLDHVCRAQTSIHLAEGLVGHRGFVRCSLGEILLGRAQVRTDSDRITIFSPFGLGVLDIALGKFTCELGEQGGTGTIIGSFLPSSWVARA
ncbi:MAG TPA: 2,3-diaminopropionate biosynthesis protein SbnB [Pyrinomonadaceae bacterium]|jgi:ornithine cyclodeaminase|nr:2,3-diaminopropionate biosynthesis protein SbnB [Pyrinomonadaceae bacterium]